MDEPETLEEHDTGDELEPLEELERAERRRRILTIVAVVVVVVAVGLYLFVPRTLASGEVGGETWRLNVAPVALTSEIQLVGAELTDADRTRVARSGGLDGSVVWHIGDDGDEDAATIVVGPTPGGVESVRVTTAERPAGEARIQRVGWRRYHVDQLPGHLEVIELVAIDASGRPIEVSELGE